MLLGSACPRNLTLAVSTIRTFDRRPGTWLSVVQHHAFLHLQHLLIQYLWHGHSLRAGRGSEETQAQGFCGVLRGWGSAGKGMCPKMGEDSQNGPARPTQKASLCTQALSGVGPTTVSAEGSFFQESKGGVSNPSP